MKEGFHTDQDDKQKYKCPMCSTVFEFKNPECPTCGSTSIRQNGQTLTKEPRPNKVNLLTGLVIGIILSSVLGYGFFLVPRDRAYNELYQENSKNLSKINELSSSLGQLETDYHSLELSYSSKNLEYNVLQGRYSSLESQYNIKVDEYNQAYSNWEGLSRDVYNFYQELQSYTNIEKAIPRVINSIELTKIADTISTVSKRADYTWDGYWNIHKYVRDEIKYAHDPDIPLITSHRYYGDENQPRITSIQTSTFQNHIQSLEFTVKNKQGDCEDQAILEYAMIQYYRKYIYGTSYSLYLARISFNDGGGHLAVFMPIVDGNICILDPAGQYQTGTWSSITQKKASTELYNYNNHWIENLGIREITLWSIDIDTGKYTEDFKGSLASCITFFSN